MRFTRRSNRSSHAVVRAGSRLRVPAAAVASSLVVALLLLAGTSAGRPAVALAAGKVSVCATVQTDPTHHPGDSADDTAIWINPTDRSQSTVIGVDKLPGGGLSVYDLTGHEKYFYPVERLNNVDIRYNVPLGSSRATIVGATNRDNGRVDFWKVNEADGSLTSVGSMPTSSAILTPRGFSMYHSPISGKYYAFVTDRGHTDQYLLDGSSGQITGTLVRQMLLHGPTEGLVADDFYGRLYVAQEDIGGVARYGAEPGDPITSTFIDTTVDNPTDPGHIVQDAKGLSMYYGKDGAGYIILASQGGNSFDVYDRGDNAWKGEFAIVDCPQYGTDKVTAIDGQDVTNVNLGPAFPEGMLATQDDQHPGTNQNYKYVPWQSIASGLGLIVDTTFDPRSIGAIPGGDTTAPETSIGAGVPVSTLDTTASIAFSSPDADVVGYECSLDAAPFTPCTSPVSYRALAVGSHTLSVRAHDLAGNVDATPASRSWIVIAPLQSQSVAPAAVVQASAPLGVTPATLQGTAKVGSTLTCAAGTFSGSPAPTLATVWLRGGVPIVGAGASTYTVVAADAGASLVCHITASNLLGTSSVSSNAVLIASQAASSASISVLAKTLAAHDRLALRVSCPATSPSTCSGSLALATAKAIALQTGAKRKIVVLGRATFHVRPGQRLLTRIALTSSGAKLVRRLGSLPVRLTTTRSGQAGIGAASVATQTFTLHRRP
jgi:myo-inositol-hexaphosphate 3-phosphohydrolase